MVASAKKIRIALAYCVAVAIFVCAFVEIFVRNWILPRDFSYIHVTRGEFPYFRLVDDFHTDGMTIRHARREPSPRGSRPRKVAFVGDSQTFGVGATDANTYEELIQTHQSEWDAYNFGVPGYGLPEVRKVVERITSEAHYDLVAYNYNFNDPLVAMSMYLPLLGDDAHRLRTVDDYEGGYGKAKHVAKEYVKFLFVLPTVIEMARKVQGLSARLPSVSREVAGSAPAPGSAQDLSCIAKNLHNLDDHGRLPKPYRLFELVYADPVLRAEVAEYFKKMKEQVTAQGGRLVVFLHHDFPLLYQSMDGPRKNMESLLAELEIPSWNTYDIYREHFKECEFFYDLGHLGANGNRYLAKELEAHLREIAINPRGA
jgi:hypothetical protein